MGIEDVLKELCDCKPCELDRHNVSQAIFSALQSEYMIRTSEARLALKAFISEHGNFLTGFDMNKLFSSATMTDQLKGNE